MAKQFLYPPINSLAGYPVLPVNPQYNTDQYMPSSKCYSQKRQQNGHDILQYFSDWVPDLTVYREDGTIFNTIACTAQTTTITNPGFTALCYQSTVDYSTFPAGKYNARFHWKDDANVDQYYQLMWINVATKWKGTLLFEYKHDENAFGILFNTGIVFNMRVEAWKINKVQLFTGDSYIDEEQNATALPSIPYEQSILSFGTIRGIPDWMGKQLNYMMQCSFILSDGEPIQKVQGAKWAIDRPELASEGEETTSNYSIDVMLVDNAFVERLNSNNVALNGYTPYVQVEKLNGIGTAQTVTLSGGWAGLHEIWINNIGAIAYVLRVGTTIGANDIGEFDIPTSDKVCEVRKAFYSSSATVYLSGFAGTSSLRVLWYDYNAVPISGPNANPVINKLLKGAQISYFEVIPGDFISDFNLSTGLGKPAGNYPNCALCDGRNGTPNLGGKFKVGFIASDVTFGIPGTDVGEDNIRITSVSQLPPFDVVIPTSENGTGNGSQGNPGWSDNESALRGSTVVHIAGTSSNIPYLPLSVISYEIMALS